MAFIYILTSHSFDPLLVLSKISEEPIDRQEFADANWPQLRGEKSGGMMDALFGGHGPKYDPQETGKTSQNQAIEE